MESAGATLPVLPLWTTSPSMFLQPLVLLHLLMLLLPDATVSWDCHNYHNCCSFSTTAICMLISLDVEVLQDQSSTVFNHFLLLVCPIGFYVSPVPCLKLSSKHGTGETNQAKKTNDMAGTDLGLEQKPNKHKHKMFVITGQTPSLFLFFLKLVTS